MRAALEQLLAALALITPALTLLVSGLLVWLGLAKSPSFLLAAGAFFYLYPPLLWRALRPVFPISHGMAGFADTKKTRPWLIAYQTQLLFGILPFAEKLLLAVPGAYSAWLRLWGSRIGRQVMWTPGVEIVDRTNIEIGDQVILGQHSYLSCHVVMKRGDRYLLYFAPIKIGSRAFIGAWSVITAGAVIDNGQVVKAGEVRGLFKGASEKNEKRDSKCQTTPATRFERA